MSDATAAAILALYAQKIEQAQVLRAIEESIHVLTAAVAVSLDVRDDRQQVIEQITAMTPDGSRNDIGYFGTMGRLAADPVKERLRPIPVGVETIATTLGGVLHELQGAVERQHELTVSVRKAIAELGAVKAASGSQ